ncbi:hypothetical protein ACFPOI_46580 [Nonomuraea angiospora]|uniref:Uncharacterized protein n=1 Tax=Nonomuraea angiospora TaxID=46172 RepID=A0ABR9LYK1_9ACTN|nr:hypothetical protein [Nonomuraea angiospora]MBE1585711.1 hypothetical protein [Nonomuraea angiospora]
MNDMEERLRAAFDAQARTYEPDPHAWARIMERRPRRRPARWLLAALPVALLTVFVPVLLNGGLGRNSAIDPTGVYQQLMKERRPLGEEVTIDNPSEGKPLRLWFAKAKLGYPELCVVVERAAAEPYGNCSDLYQGDYSDAWFVGSTLRDGAATAMDWGVARQDVGAVTGVTEGGKEFAGTLRSPDGAPYRIWTVTYPAQETLSKVEIADVKGRNVGWGTRGMISPAIQPALGASMELPEGVSVRPVRSKGGQEFTSTRAGAYVGTLRAPLPLQPTQTISRSGVIVGVARKDVARIEVSVNDGGTMTMETRPDPWNLGVALFAGPSPADARGNGYRVIAYDASGRQVHVDTVGGTNDDPRPAVGEMMTIPGTEGSGRPMRVWFNRNNEFCYSGGVVPDDWSSSTSCVKSFREGSFGYLETTSYLPEPGVVSYFGPAGEDWETVDAVLSDGRQIRGSFLRGTGAPRPVWHVGVPLGAEVGGFLMKLKNKPVKQVPIYAKDCARQAARSDTTRHTLPAGVTTLLAPNCVAFWERGEVMPSLPGPLPGGKLSDLLDEERPTRWIDGYKSWYGYALAGTVKVEATMKNGITATADAAPDPWGQGVALFAAPKPTAKEFTGSNVVLKGYGADGKELWRKALPPS